MTDPTPGLYEQLITEALIPLLTPAALIADHHPIDPAEAPEALARHLHAAILRTLHAVPGTPKEKLKRQVQLTNRILRKLHQKSSKAVTKDDLVHLVDDRPHELLALLPHQPPLPHRSPARPSIPLSTCDLLINARDEARISVDVFNEGLDVPQVDTVLMLRPTESPTIFLQQLGRGLRRAEGKACLTVLDFIGHPHARFRYDLRFRKLTGATRAEVVRHVEDDFPLLPSGCSIQLVGDARKIVLDNVRAAVRLGSQALVRELRELGPETTLAQFLDKCDIAPEDLYRGEASWTSLRRACGYPTPPAGPDERRLLKAIARVLHLDDSTRLAFWQGTLASPTPPRAHDLDGDHLAMLHFALWGTRHSPTSLDESLDRLWRHPTVLDELRALLPILEDRVDHTTVETDLPTPLRIHATYTRDEILAALHMLDIARPAPLREGVALHKATGCDVFFVTVEKSEKHYSPTTMYRDFALSENLFHWESQSTTSASSPTGQRYQRHGKDGTFALLFVRKSKSVAGTTAPYVFLGPGAYVSHEGSRPMAVTWRLLHGLPAALLRVLRLAA